MKKIYIILFLATAFGYQVCAQKHKADKLFKYYNYAEAIPLYLKTLENGELGEKRYATQKLADCYRFTNNAPKAQEWYQKAIQFDDSDAMNYFYLGQALRSLGQYEEAAAAFQSFNELAPDNEEGQRFYKYSVDIQEWMDLPPAAEIKNITELNSKYSDFAPVFYRDGIVFTSDRQTNPLLKNQTYGWTNFSYLNLYYTIPEYYKVFWNGVPEPHEMSKDFNQSYHDGPASFSEDNRWIYVTRTEMKKGKKLDQNIKTHLLKIYFAEITGEKRPNFKPFAYNNKEYSVGHPTLSKDGQKLIFSSDMPGGYGGSDLYMCTMENGKWSKPVNLGDKVNSQGHEVFPYWAGNGELFFSSDGFLGFGGLDIYRSKMEEGEWSKPENLKQPLNSSYDDFGIVLKEDLSQGLFSSNRPEGKGNDDIYAFRNLHRPEKMPVLEVKGMVKDINGNPISGATVFLLDPVRHSVKVLQTNSEGVYADRVDFDHNYVPKAMKNGYIHDCTTFRTPEAESGTEMYQVPRDLVLIKLQVDEVFKVENIYYDLDKWNIREDAKPPLDKLVRILKNYPITAELSSHTDSRASNEYNDELSQKRAESAVRYIILQGVNPARITAKGYGETRLVNKCADGVECTEEEHQANRRTEFKITSVDRSTSSHEFNLEMFEEGDVINATILGAGFFDNCLEGRERKALGASEIKSKDGKVEEKISLLTEAKSEAKVVEPKGQFEPEKPEVDMSGAIEPKYRVQLMASSRDFNPVTHFPNLVPVLEKYGVTKVKEANLYKYQIGNFSSNAEAKKLQSVLLEKGCNGCFIIKAQ